jgi:hypothetical protein
MTITLRARIARAWKGVTADRHWFRELGAAVLVALVTYKLLGREAMPELINLAIASGVGLFAVPVAEFAWHFWQAPHVIELEILRAENTSLRQSIPAANGPTETSLASVAPIRPYLREATSDEVRKRLRGLKWNERDAIAQISYVGRWVRWRGQVGAIVALGSEGDRGYIVLTYEAAGFGGFPVSLEFPPSQREVVHGLEEGQLVEYEGKIIKASTGEMSVSDVTILKYDT